MNKEGGGSQKPLIRKRNGSIGLASAEEHVALSGRSTPRSRNGLLISSISSGSGIGTHFARNKGGAC